MPSVAHREPRVVLVWACRARLGTTARLARDFSRPLDMVKAPTRAQGCHARWRSGTDGGQTSLGGYLAGGTNGGQTNSAWAGWGGGEFVSQTNVDRDDEERGHDGCFHPTHDTQADAAQTLCGFLFQGSKCPFDTGAAAP